MACGRRACAARRAAAACPSAVPGATAAAPAATQVRLAERYERHFGRAAHASLCVTRAMQRELAKGWRIPATVFYDRPPAFFQPASLEVRGRGGVLGVALLAGSALPWHMPTPPCLPPPLPRRRNMPCCSTCSRRWRSRCTPPTLWQSCMQAASWALATRCAPRRAAAAARASGRGAPPWWSAAPAGRRTRILGCSSRQPRCGLCRAAPCMAAQWREGSAGRVGRSARACRLSLPSPAAQLYDGRVRRSRHPGRYPRILFLVTGRGPQRAAYEARMRGLDLRHVAFRCAGLGCVGAGCVERSLGWDVFAEGRREAARPGQHGCRCLLSPAASCPAVPQDAVARAAGLPAPAGVCRPGRLPARLLLRPRPAHEGARRPWLGLG